MAALSGTGRWPRHRSRGNAVLALGACLLWAAPAAAELYRCVEPGGELVFTDSPASCRGARRHDTSGELQTVETPPEAPERAAAPARAPRPTVEEHRQERRVWQQKKRTAERELAREEERSAELRRYVTACNRGRSIVGQDGTGLKYTVSCERVREEYAASEARIAPLREYLETGLRRECRQAGCLPGWIR